jgi:hypothetical protein
MSPKRLGVAPDNIASILLKLMRCRFPFELPEPVLAFVGVPLTGME